MFTLLAEWLGRGGRYNLDGVKIFAMVDIVNNLIKVQLKFRPEIQ